MQLKRRCVRALVMFGLAASLLIGGLAAVAGEGDISTVAGNGTAAFAGDGGQATSGSLNGPIGVDVTDGVLRIADTNNNRIRQVDLSTGVISTIAGTGIANSGADGSDALATDIEEPFGVVVGDGGDVFFSEDMGSRVRRIDGTTNIVSTLLGNGTAACTVTNGAVGTAVSVDSPVGLARRTRRGLGGGPVCGGWRLLSDLQDRRFGRNHLDRGRHRHGGIRVWRLFRGRGPGHSSRIRPGD